MISVSEAEKIALDNYGIAAKATILPGYDDENFKLLSTAGESFILKISKPEADEKYITFQNEILIHITSKNLECQSPRVIYNLDYELSDTIKSAAGEKRDVRLLSWVEGRLWAHINPKTESLRFDLGEKAGKITEALKGFNNEVAQRSSNWDLADSSWTLDHLELFSEKEKEQVTYFQRRFSEIQPIYNNLPRSIIHGDFNDYNIIVSEDLKAPKIIGFIDFGDAVQTQTINDLAILLAYAIMDTQDPLEAALDVIKGYNKNYQITDRELDCMYSLVAMRLITTVTSSALRKLEDPTNKYHLISEKPAWKLLHKWFAINEEFARYCFRDACSFNPHPSEETFKNWTATRRLNFSDLFPSFLSSETSPNGAEKEEIELLDLKVSSTWMGSKSDFNDLELFQFKIDQLQNKNPAKLIAGGYCEPRPIYTSKAYDKEGNNGPESRTYHLGIDFWLPESTPVHAMFDGEIFTATNDAGFKEYGGLIILKHTEDNLTFYTLHGHLSVASIQVFKVGDKIKKGDCIGHLGGPQENGAWAPHLHFQLMLSMLDFSLDFPGVTYANQLRIWKSICPDPNLLFKNKNLVTQYSLAEEELIAFRKNHLGKSLSLSYEKPLHIVRGEGVYLIDPEGRKYLDTVNNVAHIGHEHPKVVAAGQKQMALLNTNTRYLHEEIIAYSEALLKKLPKELSVLHIVNSGSEANELALRMAMVCTGQRDMLAIEAGYHGNTNAVIEVSSYKFDGNGGKGKPADTHILPLPDPYRGRHIGEDSGADYAKYAKKHIQHLKIVDEEIAGFIGECIISCGGQIVPPKNYFKEVYRHIREAGGICIADEVQTGFGRMGKTFWAFELFDVVPDIVTMGKPAGNGHPIAIVACTKEVAEKFSNGMEFFNTFGGNPVSCAIGRTVLEVIEEENLQQNALEVGEFLKVALKELQHEFPIIGDVRGEGLFLGFELNTSEKKPLAGHATYLANRMKSLGILMSTDGPDYNVLKVKPPMVFSKENAEELIYRLKTVFAEDFMTHY
ncbi:MAG: 4-aminobutyrate aminotransferase-like enzyme/Ser/Thr protein kinase RdoA (MazF antagonist) [Ulvibacter sp.]|jgi:4-aminobutyrate aminotransferase-like enzyme/Ser/Thr protein kinase RdoA (MazF antagonist)